MNWVLLTKLYVSISECLEQQMNTCRTGHGQKTAALGKETSEGREAPWQRCSHAREYLDRVDVYYAATVDFKLSKHDRNEGFRF